MKNEQIENSNFFWFEKKGKLSIATTVVKETNSNQLTVCDDRVLKNIQIGNEVCIASSNDRAKILSIEDDIVTLDRLVNSANADKILKGEMLIFL